MKSSEDLSVCEPLGPRSDSVVLVSNEFVPQILICTLVPEGIPHLALANSDSFLFQCLQRHR